MTHTVSFSLSENHSCLTADAWCKSFANRIIREKEKGGENDEGEERDMILAEETK